MMIVHECGHVLAAWATGGRVTRVVLHPLAFSRTDLSHNPSPRLVAASGAVFGVFAPAALLMVAPAAARWRCVARFFAAFCMLANGVYMASACLDPVGDAHDLLRLGAPAWTLALPGSLAAAGGLWLFHGLGASFGLKGKAPDPAIVKGTVALAVGTALAMATWSVFTPS